MFTKALFESSIKNAIANPDNIKEDGSIDWDFVDADVILDLCPTVAEMGTYMVWFNEFADEVEGK